MNVTDPTTGRSKKDRDTTPFQQVVNLIAEDTFHVLLLLLLYYCCYYYRDYYYRLHKKWMILIHDDMILPILGRLTLPIMKLRRKTFCNINTNFICIFFAPTEQLRSTSCGQCSAPGPPATPTPDSGPCLGRGGKFTEVSPAPGFLSRSTLLRRNEQTSRPDLDPYRVRRRQRVFGEKNISRGHGPDGRSMGRRWGTYSLDSALLLERAGAAGCPLGPGDM